MSARRLTDGDHIEAVLGESDAELQPFAWTATGEVYHPGSSVEWQGHVEQGVIHATGPYEALLKLITGFGRMEPGDEGIGILPDGDRPMTFTIEPVEIDA